MKICKHQGCLNPATVGRQCQPCRNYMTRYGMSQPEVSQMLAGQDNTCKLCGKTIILGKYSGVVDHCHIGGKIRGVLCHDCNVTVGYLENTKIDLDKLKEYLS